jgi:hypothetical protein
LGPAAVTDHADQYTPDEVLEAARNAEADGRRDYAVQFYTYLARAYPGTAFGQTARDALTRLREPVPPGGDLTEARTAPPPPHPSPAKTAPPQLGANLRLDDFDPSPMSMAERLSPGAARLQAQGHGGRQPVDPYGVSLGPAAGPAMHPGRDQPRAKPALPPRSGGFLVGRVLAWCVTIVGVLVLMIAFAFLALNILDPTRAQELGAVFQVTGSPLVIWWLLLSGFSMVLAGQLMSAIFVTAIETRDAARVLRARAGED